MALKLAVVAAVLFVVGPAGARIEILRPLLGFALFALGGLLGIVAAVWGALSGLRGNGWLGGAIGVVVAATFIAIAAPSTRYPPFNDFTTDTEDPPRFVNAGKLAANDGRDLGYPAGEVLDAQLEAYPDLLPLRLALPPAQAFERARQAARRMPNWEVLVEDAGAGLIEGVATSALFRFRDDFVIRIRAEDGGSRVDMRSKSRDGRGDLGANANRIRRFFAAMEATDG